MMSRTWHREHFSALRATNHHCICCNFVLAYHAVCSLAIATEVFTIVNHASCIKNLIINMAPNVVKMLVRTNGDQLFAKAS